MKLRMGFLDGVTEDMPVLIGHGMWRGVAKQSANVTIDGRLGEYLLLSQGSLTVTIAVLCQQMLQLLHLKAIVHTAATEIEQQGGKQADKRGNGSYCGNDAMLQFSILLYLSRIVVECINMSQRFSIGLFHQGIGEEFVLLQMACSFFSAAFL